MCVSVWKQAGNKCDLSKRSSGCLYVSVGRIYHMCSWETIKLTADFLFGLDVCASNMDSTNSMRLGRGYLFNRPMEGRGSVHKISLFSVFVLGMCISWLRPIRYASRCIANNTIHNDTYEAGTDAIRFTSNKYLSKMYIFLQNYCPPIRLLSACLARCPRVSLAHSWQQNGCVCMTF